MAVNPASGRTFFSSFVEIDIDGVLVNYIADFRYDQAGESSEVVKTISDSLYGAGVAQKQIHFVITLGSFQAVGQKSFDINEMDFSGNTQMTVRLNSPSAPINGLSYSEGTTFTFTGLFPKKQGLDIAGSPAKNTIEFFATGQPIIQSGI